MGDGNAEWVEPDEQSSSEEIVEKQYSPEDILEGLDHIPRRADIIAVLEEFRGPFAQTRRRELAAELWPEYASQIWDGTWETPDAADVDPETGEVTEGLRWSDTAGCPVHVQATSEQETSVGTQAVDDANTAVDSIIQSFEEVLDDAMYENSLWTAQRMSKAADMIEAYDDEHSAAFGSIEELFESDWTGDLASEKGKKYFGRDALELGTSRQSTFADYLLSAAVDDIRMQITVHATLAQAVNDAYEAMSEKTHTTTSLGILQTIADAIGTLGAWTKVVPGAASFIGWASGMLTKAGDFVITVSIERIASTNDIEAWTSDLVEAAATAQETLDSGRSSTEENSDEWITSVRLDLQDWIPGEGYQDE